MEWDGRFVGGFSVGACTFSCTSDCSGDTCDVDREGQRCGGTLPDVFDSLICASKIVSLYCDPPPLFSLQIVCRTPDMACASELTAVYPLRSHCASGMSVCVRVPPTQARTLTAVYEAVLLKAHAPVHLDSAGILGTAPSAGHCPRHSPRWPR